MSTSEATPQFEALLEFLKQSRGFDFTGYKRATLERRVQVRLARVGADDYAHYTEYLELHPEEFDELFNTILINVTSFRRDDEAWDALRDGPIKQIADGAAERPIRVWTAGCSSGEETYTIMMMLADALGIERFKKQVKVYATDADTEALAEARLATYSAEQLETLPEEWRSRYFEPAAAGFVFRNDLRRSVIFGVHDLVQDAPISHLDLLICRNTLIYFNSETQARILSRFHFALKEHGFLFLGRAEMLLTHSRLFAPVAAKSRIFRKVASPNLRDRLLAMTRDGEETVSETQQQVRIHTFDTAPTAQIVLDAEGAVLLANEQARTMFRLSAHDIGRPIQDLELSYRPLELRSRIEEATAAGAIITVKDVEFRPPYGELRYYDIQITPLSDQSRTPLGTSVTFLDVTAQHWLTTEYERASHELEAANHELNSTNEKLETTNEELESTIEELETTNEELQSTNEELETLNEELQSTNEELEAINDELQRRTRDLNTVNDFLEAIMTSIKAGVVVTDANLHVLRWNRRAEDMWGLRQDEVAGKAFSIIDIGLPVDQLAREMRECLDGKGSNEPVVLDAVNRRGRSIRCRVSFTPLVSAQHGIRGLIVFMEEFDAERSSS